METKKNDYLVKVNTTIKMWVSASSTQEAKELAQTHMLCLATGITKGVKIVQTQGTTFGVEGCDIMDTTNNHNPHLVEYINYAHRNHPKEFKDIICLLATRDIDEMYDNDVHPRNTPYEEVARTYLMYVADNDDLETILRYCRVEY